MAYVNLNDYDRFLIEEKLRVIRDYERKLAREGRIPDVDRLLFRRLRGPIQALGGLLLGGLIALVSLIANFVIFNMIIHI